MTTKKHHDYDEYPDFSIERWKKIFDKSYIYRTFLKQYNPEIIIDEDFADFPGDRVVLIRGTEILCRCLADISSEEESRLRFYSAELPIASHIHSSADEIYKDYLFMIYNLATTPTNFRINMGYTYFEIRNFAARKRNINPDKFNAIKNSFND